MIAKVKFKNLEKSELAKSIVLERLEGVVEKFPLLVDHDITFTLEMANSPKQNGPDCFIVKVVVDGKKYKNIVLSQENINLYIATAYLFDNLTNRLNRFGDKQRVKKISNTRKLNLKRGEL